MGHGSQDRMPTVSVITCAYTEDRWGDLTAAVESIRGQTVTADELILVVDNNATLLARARRAFPDVLVLPNSHAQGASGARNAGAESARGDILAFLDDDARAEPSWLEDLIQPFGDPLVAGVGGRALPLWAAARPLWFPPEFDWVVGCSYVGLPLTASIVRNPIGTNMSVRRDLMASVSGFREGFGNVVIRNSTRPPTSRLSTCEETEFCIRVAHAHPTMTWIYQPSATVYHRVPSARSTMRYFFARCWLEGQGKASLTRLVGRSDSLAAERAYARKTIPHGIRIGLVDAMRHPGAGGLSRAVIIATGAAVVALSYLVNLYIARPRLVAPDSRSG